MKDNYTVIIEICKGGLPIVIRKPKGIRLIIRETGIVDENTYYPKSKKIGR